ncbi:MAG: putative oxidoreductase YcjS [Verrucomicrobia bacterium ADurb.Bin118]|nr:MAG: putative oxidoreductase YcjS [Verrucomicrobia bacterium ADurb.Bin118]
MKSKLRLGIIGAGSVVREIYQYLYFRSDYSPLLEICAVADPNEAYRDWFGDLAGLPPARRFADYQTLLAQVELDAVQVNTPDHLHCAPTLAALQAGLDVVVPKPTAATLKDCHAMIQAAQQTGRFLGVDFHKRDDPRIKEAEARFQSGRYGTFQAAVFYMVDRLCIANPNHSPRFFASPDFAEKNTPASFLTVHMADALMKIINLVPVQVRALGYAHKLPALEPIAVRGYDLVDTEVLFHTGAVAHIITGWAIPDTAWANTVQSGRLICSDGLIDLALDMPGLREIHADGIFEVNPLFKNFEKDGRVTGYGISGPGRLYRQILDLRNQRMSEADQRESRSPLVLGFHTALVLEAAEKSLAAGQRLDSGATLGTTIDLRQLVVAELGAAAARDYGYT